jgi:Na+/melibiose symporter-like transporter
MPTTQRGLRIVVASALTIIFTVWSVHLFESQPSAAPTVQIPKCPTSPPTHACLDHALKVAFSGNLNGRWALWVVWIFWSLIAIVWLAACAFILWAPRRADDSVSFKIDEASIDEPLAGSVK